MAVLQNASGIALVQVTDLVRQRRPADVSEWETVCSFKAIRATGSVPESIILDPGKSGMVPRYFRFKDSIPVTAVPLELGKRYWIAFDHVLEKDQTGVLACWPEESGLAETLNEAVSQDRLQWHPIVNGRVGSYFGYKFNADAQQFSVRAWTGEKVLWERTTNGYKNGSLEAWGYPQIVRKLLLSHALS